jgi:hypothetical protein
MQKASNLQGKSCLKFFKSHSAVPFNLLHFSVFLLWPGVHKESGAQDGDGVHPAGGHPGEDVRF